MHKSFVTSDHDLQGIPDDKVITTEFPDGYLLSVIICTDVHLNSQNSGLLWLLVSLLKPTFSCDMAVVKL